MDFELGKSVRDVRAVLAAFGQELDRAKSDTSGALSAAQLGAEVGVVRQLTRDLTALLERGAAHSADVFQGDARQTLKGLLEKHFHERKEVLDALPHVFRRLGDDGIQRMLHVAQAHMARAEELRNLDAELAQARTEASRAHATLNELVSRCNQHAARPRFWRALRAGSFEALTQLRDAQQDAARSASERVKELQAQQMEKTRQGGGVPQTLLSAHLLRLADAQRRLDLLEAHTAEIVCELRIGTPVAICKAATLAGFPSSSSPILDATARLADLTRLAIQAEQLKPVPTWVNTLVLGIEEAWKLIERADPQEVLGLLRSPESRKLPDFNTGELTAVCLLGSKRPHPLSETVCASVFKRAEGIRLPEEKSALYEVLKALVAYNLNELDPGEVGAYRFRPAGLDVLVERGPILSSALGRSLVTAFCASKTPADLIVARVRQGASIGFGSDGTFIRQLGLLQAVHGGLSPEEKRRYIQTHFSPLAPADFSLLEANLRLAASANKELSMSGHFVHLDAFLLPDGVLDREVLAHTVSRFQSAGRAGELYFVSAGEDPRMFDAIREETGISLTDRNFFTLHQLEGTKVEGWIGFAPEVHGFTCKTLVPPPRRGTA